MISTANAKLIEKQAMEKVDPWTAVGDILESCVVFQQHYLILRAYTRVLPKIGPIPSGHTYHTFYVDHNEASDDASVWSGLVTPGFNLFW